MDISRISSYNKTLEYINLYNCYLVIEYINLYNCYLVSLHSRRSLKSGKPRPPAMQATIWCVLWPRTIIQYFDRKYKTRGINVVLSENINPIPD
jgi:hypothetical protein